MSHPVALCAAALVAATLALPATAQTVITRWNFNSGVADGNTGTGTTLPAIGTGTAALVGGATATFASGDASGGSSDPASGDDSGWNTTTYAASGAGDKTRGASYLVSTVGWQDIVLSYDLRHSNTSARHEAVQYTLNGGASWIDFTTFDGNAGDTWFNGRSVDLSAIVGADDNASFGFRVLATFAPGGSTYLPSNPASSYGTTGTWRFDMVTVSALAPIPEPGTYAMLLAGLAAVGAVARRRQRA
jgi:hypothetical protein